MRNKDTGEFELVVGDRQLISGFFIEVLLLAVFFALGYFVGQNSPRSQKLASDPSGSAVTNAQESRPQPAGTVAAAAPPPAETTPVSTAAAPPATEASSAATKPEEAPPQPTTQPAREISAPAPAPPPAPKTEEAQGSYWQVHASKSRTSAGAVLQSLVEKGLPATLKAGANNLTLVWVGPYSDRGELAKARTQLEQMGFTPLRKP